MTYNTRASRRSAAGRRAKVYLAGSTAMIGAVFVCYQLLPAIVRLDESLCPIDQPLAGHTILLVDKTDFHTLQGREALRSWIADLKAEIRPGERLSIRLISDDPESVTRPIFVRCNPGDGSGESRYWGNPEKKKRLWTESFEKPLEKVLGSLLDNRETNASPILESVELVMWDKAFGAQVPRRRLILLSDFLQNVPGHSHYKALMLVGHFMRTELGRKLSEKVWRGVRVDLGYLRSEKSSGRQGAAHIAFWRSLFEDALGAGPVHVIPPFMLPGRGDEQVLQGPPSVQGEGQALDEMPSTRRAKQRPRRDRKRRT